MSASTAKKHEERQQALEELAERIVVEQGMEGLSIEKLASKAGFSRPTVYQHFRSKSDALDCVIHNMIAVSKEIFGRLEGGINGPERSREQALGLFIAYEQLARFHPNTFHVAELLGFPWVQETAPQGSLENYGAIVAGYFSQVADALTLSLGAGQLKLPMSVTPHHVAFHSIVMIYGIFSSILKKRVTYHLAEMPDAWQSARQALHSYWDGCGWQPLSSEFDYEETYEHVLKSAFPEYWLKAHTERLAREVNLGHPRS